ncbi:NAD(P)/FAD-dependent oxidoreductase [Dethiothermospora halolimnae]|uniref:NAD(P)/FAD-dependent oxidoreductase n=1 Tax=Dethiothermospora halolimnae TaxID=3114390 RepID=UPI003CCBB2F1
MNNKIVVVGNGIAGITAIKSIRKIDTESEIHLFGDEKFNPYNRVRLSKGLLNKLEEDKILLQKKDWYQVNKIKLYKDTKVICIDTAKKEITLSNNSKMSYTKLLLANGASNIEPPISGIDKLGVLTLRTLEDAWNIIDGLKSKKKVLNIGGGIQGLETAWILSQMGKKVVLAELLPRIMPKQLDEKASKILKRAVENKGIEVMIGTRITEIYGDGEVEGFKTANGDSISCDMVTYSIGIKPNIELLKGSGIDTDKGIIVNKRMETNIKDIYAAGDVAELNNQIYGLWNISIGHGKVAGLNIVGEESIYEHIVPVTTLNAFNISLFSMGVVNEKEATNIVLEDRAEENVYNKVFIKDNRVIGAIVIGNIRYSPILKIAIEKDINLSGVDYENVSFDELLEIIKERK